MLTIETLKQIEGVKDLSDDILKKISVASANDENAVIAAKTKEIWSSIDKDMLEELGAERPAADKTYDFNKTLYRELKQLRGSKESYAQMKTDYEALKKSVKEGKGNEAQLQKLEKDLQTAQAKVQTLTDRYNTDIAAKDAEIKQKAEEVKTTQVNTLFENVRSKLQFKEGYSDVAQKAIFDSFKNTVLGSYQLEGVGTSDLVIKDESGLVVKNPENENRPMTLLDLAGNKLKQDLKVATAAPGGKFEKSKGGPNPTGAFQLTAKSRNGALIQINEYLNSEGLTVDNPARQKEMNRLWTENKVSELPQEA